MIIYKSMLKRVLNRCHKRAFTLTEVLLAVAIVGIIAALVLPALISYYQEQAFAHLKSRQAQSLEEAYRSLIVKENKAKFNETIMYSANGTDIEDTAGTFLKKYFRVAKYCGVITSGQTTDCFADEYYQYSDRDKKVLPQADVGLEGACAQLKNGVSICLMPQVGATPAHYIMDMNGPKGPNVYGRDLVIMPDLDTQDMAAVDRSTDGNVYSEDHDAIASKEPSKCVSESDSSNGCCEERRKKNDIKPGSACCRNINFVNEAACVSKVTIILNYYPTSSEYTSGARPYVNTSVTSAVSPSQAIDTLPDLTVKIKCGDGSTQGGTLSLSSFKSGLKSKAPKTYFSGNIYSSTCAYNTESLLWTVNNSTTYTKDGVQYIIDKR